MFEKEAEEIVYKNLCSKTMCYNHCSFSSPKHHRCGEWHRLYESVKEGAEFGYNKGKEDVKYDLMMKLKDDGIVTPLKDSIFYNQRLSSQEQQELCSWIECAMDFGENLDEYSEQLEYAKTIIQDLLDNSDEYARQRGMDFLEKKE